CDCGSQNSVQILNFFIYLFFTENSKRTRRLYRQQVPQTRHSSSHCLQNCLRFCFKVCGKNVDKAKVWCVILGATVEPQPDPTTAGGLRELTTSWFIQTQAPRISHNGLLPKWFLGFISRKDAEDILKNKEVGCFLIRLSDKALGYILSYKGRDRCRHFVINESESGGFVVHGDNIRHATVSELVEYYKEKPIEPFGEYLTASCYMVNLYDTIQVSPKERSVATVHAQKAKKKMSNRGSELQLAQPRGSDHSSQVEGSTLFMSNHELPPLPRRSKHLENGTESQDNVCYAQVRRKKLKDREVKRDGPSRPQSLYSEVELLDSRSRSLPLLLNSSDEQNYRLSITPPRLERDTPSPEPSHRLDVCWPTPPSSDPGTREEDGGVYAEVLGPHRLQDDTYEQIPDSSNPYEPVGRLRRLLFQFISGPIYVPASLFQNEKWKRLFPEVKRKW
uniref:SH2 domain-containing protein n=1 Tax=Periophthalmus magnuspinnatus TaxID=409849 RepID=A0A3B3ZJP2_9GOBI